MSCKSNEPDYSRFWSAIALLSLAATSLVTQHSLAATDAANPLISIRAELKDYYDFRRLDIRSS